MNIDLLVTPCDLIEKTKNKTKKSFNQINNIFIGHDFLSQH